MPYGFDKRYCELSPEEKKIWRKRYRQEYHLKNRERENARNKKYYEKQCKNNPVFEEKKKAYAKKYRDTHRDSLAKAFIDKAHRVRDHYIKLLGGKCSNCGSTERLEFHHTDTKSKEINLGNHWTHSKEKLDKEISKCVLLCKKCHKALHVSRGDWGRHLKRRVMCIETGKCYNSLMDCERDTGIGFRTISAICSGKKSDINGYHFKYIDND